MGRINSSQPDLCHTYVLHTQDLSTAFPSQDLVLLGQGGFGTVHRVAGQQVVVKVTVVDMLDPLQSPQATIAACKAEYRIARALASPKNAHPCLLPAHQLFATADPITNLPAMAMVMPLAEGVPLDDFMQVSQCTQQHKAMHMLCSSFDAYIIRSKVACLHA